MNIFLNKKKKVLAVALSIIFVLTSIMTEVSRTGTVKAGEIVPATIVKVAENPYQWTNDQGNVTTVANVTLANGQKVFCTDHSLTRPTNEAVTEQNLNYNYNADLSKQLAGNTDYLKVLYYGWSGKEQWSGFTSEAQGAAITSLSLSYIKDGSFAERTIYDSTFNEFLEYINGAPVPISYASTNMYISSTADTVKLSGVQKALYQNGVLRTNNFCMRMKDSNYKATTTVPVGTTMYIARYSEGYANYKAYTAGQVVTVCFGDYFYYTAPATYSGVVNPKFTGEDKYEVVLYEPSVSGYQNMVYGSYVSGGADSISIQFEAATYSLSIDKQPEIQSFMSIPGYSFEGAEFYVYYNKNRVANMTDSIYGIFRSIKSEKAASGDCTSYVVYNAPAGVDLRELTNEQIKNKGITTLNSLPEGYYTVIEVKAPTGGNCGVADRKKIYFGKETDEAVDYVNSNVSVKTTVVMSEKMPNDPFDVVINKIDSEGIVNNDIASLEGTVFQVKYYDGLYNSVEELPAATASWCIKTIKDEYGRYTTRLDKNHIVEVEGCVNSEFYVDPFGAETLPLGTITIEEIRAADNYSLDNVSFVSVDKEYNTYEYSGNIFIAQIRKDNSSISGATIYGANEEVSHQYYVFNTVLEGGELNVGNHVKRADLYFTKYATSNGNDKKTVSGIPFKISLLNSKGEIVESHVAVTDTEGVLSTKSEDVSHKNNTNNNDNLISVNVDNYKEYDGFTVSGIWFYGSTETTDTSSVSDEYGALVPGEYIVEELPCSVNENLQLEAFSFTVTENGKVYSVNSEMELVNIENPYLTTLEKDRFTNTHMTSSGEAEVIDTVNINNVLAGETYSVIGILMELDESGEVAAELKDDNGKCIISYNYGTVQETELTDINEKLGKLELDVLFTFPAYKLGGKRFVVYEYLFNGEVDITDINSLLQIEEMPSIVTVWNGEIVSHKEIVDNQIGYFPVISTTAHDKDSDNKEIQISKIIEITDTVTYNNLEPGKEYSLSAVLMDKKTGDKLLDSDDKEITGSVIFVPKSSNGTVEVLFEFDGSCYESIETVVFEYLYYDGIVIATHTDIEDKGQTVKLYKPDKPDIPEKPDKPLVPEKPNAPKTGDDIYLTIIMMIAVISITGMLLVINKRKINNK